MRFLGRLGLLIALLFAGGFGVFAISVPDAETFDLTDAKTEFADLNRTEVGVVILTGGGGARIQNGLNLFDPATEHRVLISGTHPDVRKVDLAQRFDTTILECCVDLGTEAQTTIGNARETAEWVAQNEYTAIYLVTHDYHLPRAMLEIRGFAPDLKVVGVPVQGPTGARRWKLLATEYGKFLLSLVRSVM